MYCAPTAFVTFIPNDKQFCVSKSQPSLLAFGVRRTPQFILKSHFALLLHLLHYICLFRRYLKSALKVHLQTMKIPTYQLN